MATATKAKKKAKKAAPTVTVTVAAFDDSRFDVFREGVPISDFRPITRDEYEPRGMTPLRDATAKFIKLLDEQRTPDSVTIGLLGDASGSMSHNRDSVVSGINEFVEGMTDVEAVDQDAAGKVLCVILTDGLENASHEMTREALAAMVADREKDGYTFIYMGANQDAWREAAGLGYSGGATGQSVNFVASASGTRAAMRSVTTDASAFLGNNSTYLASAASFSQRSVGEDGQVTTASGAQAPPSAQAPAPTTSSSYDSVADALAAAKGATKA